MRVEISFYLIKGGSDPLSQKIYDESNNLDAGFILSNNGNGTDIYVRGDRKVYRIAQIEKSYTRAVEELKQEIQRTSLPSKVGKILKEEKINGIRCCFIKKGEDNLVKKLLDGSLF